MSTRRGPSIARKREEQGRLFWVWLLTLPLLLLMGASRAFGAPWPNPLTLRIGYIMLAFPVLFVVGEPVFRDALASARQKRLDLGLLVGVAAAGCYASSVLSLFTPAPPLGGISALVVSAYLTRRYITSRY